MVHKNVNIPFVSDDYNPNLYAINCIFQLQLSQHIVVYTLTLVTFQAYRLQLAYAEYFYFVRGGLD